MNKNVGAIDGVIRILIFMIGMIYAILTGAWYWMVPGTILLVTALAQWCPLYEVIGMRTLKDEPNHQQ